MIRVRVTSLHAAIRPLLAAQSARVESVHRRAINLRLASGRLVTLCAPALGNGPGALLVEASWPLPWRAGERVSITPAEIYGPGLSVELAGATDWAPEPAPDLGELALVRQGWQRAVGELGAAGGAFVGASAESSRVGDESSRIGDESCRVGDEWSRVGDEWSRVGNESCRVGDESCRVGDESCRVGDERSRVDDESCRVGEEWSRVGDESCRVGDESCTVGGESCTVGGESCTVGAESWGMVANRGQPASVPTAIAEPMRSLAVDGLSALQAGDWSTAVARLVGLGPGLTPSGDDLLAGFLLCAIRAEWPVAAPLAAAIRSGALGRTTSVSESLLHWATAGVANERALHWLDGLLQGAPPPLDPVLAIGATSGADWATGALLALDLYLKERAV